MKAVINYIVLVVVGSVLSLLNTPLQKQLALSLAIPTKSASQSKPTLVHPWSLSLNGLNAMPVRLPATGSFPDMVHMPPCHLLDKLDGGQVFDADGKPAGRVEVLPTAPNLPSMSGMLLTSSSAPSDTVRSEPPSSIPTAK